MSLGMKRRVHFYYRWLLLIKNYYLFEVLKPGDYWANSQQKIMCYLLMISYLKPFPHLYFIH